MCVQSWRMGFRSYRKQLLNLWSGALLGSSRGGSWGNTVWLQKSQAVRVILLRMWGFALSLSEMKTPEMRINEHTHWALQQTFSSELPGHPDNSVWDSPAVSAGIIRFKWYWRNRLLYFPACSGWTWALHITSVQLANITKPQPGKIDFMSLKIQQHSYYCYGCNLITVQHFWHLDMCRSHHLYAIGGSYWGDKESMEHCSCARLEMFAQLQRRRQSTGCKSNKYHKYACCLSKNITWNVNLVQEKTWKMRVFCVKGALSMTQKIKEYNLLKIYY